MEDRSDTNPWDKRMDSLIKLSDVACQELLAQAGSSEIESSETKTFPSPLSGPLSSSSSSASSSASPSSSSTLPTNKQKAAEVIAESDRGVVREKIKAALRKKAQSYDNLLDLCAMVVEEDAFHNAPSKLDYYKAGISRCKRVFDIGNAHVVAAEAKAAAVEQVDDTPARALKRAKTQH